MFNDAIVLALFANLCYSRAGRGRQGQAGTSRIPRPARVRVRQHSNQEFKNRNQKIPKNQFAVVHPINFKNQFA